MKFEYEPFCYMPARDDGRMALLPLLGRAFVVYLAKQCKRRHDGASSDRFQIRSGGDVASAIVSRFGGNHHDVPVVKRLLDEAIKEGAIVIEQADNEREVRIVDFMGWQEDFDQRLRRFYASEKGGYAKLSFTTRMIGTYCAKSCDDNGRFPGASDASDVMSHLMHVGGGVTKGKADSDRRLVKKAIENLIDEGFLAARGNYVYVKNFLQAQPQLRGQPDSTRTAEATAQSARVEADATAADDQHYADAVTASPQHSTAPAAAPPRTDTDVISESCPTQASAVDASTARNHDEFSGSLPPSLPVPQVPPSRLVSTVADAATRTECTTFALTAPDPVAKKPRSKKAAFVDPVPNVGAPARMIYDAIVCDDVLRPITAGPGDLAHRFLRDFTELEEREIARLVRDAGSWLVEKPQKSDGRAFLRNWIKREVADRESRPKPASSLDNVRHFNRYAPPINVSEPVAAPSSNPRWDEAKKLGTYTSSAMFGG